MDLASFKKILFGLCQFVDGKMLAIYEPEVTPNFYTAEVELDNEKLYILCSTEGYWAFSSSFHHCSLNFIESDKLTQALVSLYGIRPLTAEELNGPFKVLPWMTESDIKYWKPKTYGEGVFNWWD